MDAYYIFWALIIIVGLWLSLAGFLWALRQNQLSQQERARYLPLRGEDGPVPPQTGSGAFWEKALLLGIILLGTAGLVAAVLTTIFTPGRIAS